MSSSVRPSTSSPKLRLGECVKLVRFYLGSRFRFSTVGFHLNEKGATPKETGAAPRETAGYTVN